MIPADGVFVDLGCGKGRVLLIASQFCFREVRGVEFAQELCEIAKDNCAVYKSKTGVGTEFRIIESDVVDYIIKTNEIVFYMFNPFDDKVLTVVLNNIARSLKIKPRKILTIYFNPLGGNFIEQHHNFIKWGEVDCYGYNFTVYTNRD
jgi:SAM-dependent methyltransferase